MTYDETLAAGLCPYHKKYEARKRPRVTCIFCWAKFIRDGKTLQESVDRMVEGGII
ncbi:MAG: hypothetical protein LC723_14655 [Actinobacteria bacterium]|nr:hypothetical protein [Actinomycetota bacterium]